MQIYQAFHYMYRVIFLCLHLIFVGAAFEEARGQSGRPLSDPSQSATQPTTPLDTAVPPLLLNEVLRLVDSNHPKLTSADIERQVADAKLLEKQAAFDPVISFDSGYLRYNSTSTPGKIGNAYQNEAAVEWQTRSGLKYFAGTRFNLGNVKSPLSSTGTGGEYFAGVALPLMRNFRMNPKFAAEQQAQIGRRISNTEFAATRLGLFVDASTNYWDWVAAKKRLDVNQNLLKISQTRADQVINRVKAGDLPPIDETEATQEVQRRLGGVVKAERDLQKSTFKLSLYLWTDRNIPAPLPVASQVPDALPMPTALLPFVVQNGVERALSQRPELENLDLARAFSQVDSELARNARRPNFDLYIAPGRDTGIDSIGTTMKVGVTVSLPFGRRAAEAQLAQAELKLQKISNERELAEQRISVEVRDLANAVNTSYGRFLLAQRELELARALEEGERRRFELGDSTLFLVNQRERAAAEAEIKVIDVRAEYEQALAAFRVATVEY